MFPGRFSDTERIFKAKHDEYLGVCKKVFSLQKAMQKYLEKTKEQAAAAAALAVELSFFYKDTAGEATTKPLGQLYAELERIQLASVEKLFEDEVIHKTEAVLWKYQEILDKVEERKKLKAQNDKTMKKYESKRSQLNDIANKQLRRKGRRKSDAEIAEQLFERGSKLEMSQKTLNDSTNWLLQQFEEIIGKRREGKLLEIPVSALIACQYHLNNERTTRLNRVRRKFPQCEIWNKTLMRYDEDNIRGIKRQEVLAGGKGAVFGRNIKSSTPPIICDCMAFIRAKGIDTEGLFRIPGSTGVISEVKLAYDEGRRGAVDTVERVEVHEVCGLMKLFLRSMPEPLIPYAQYHDMLATVRGSNYESPDLTLKNLLLIAKSIKSPRRELFGMLMLFLNEIAQYEERNKMSSNTLATCIAPSIGRSDNKSPLSLMTDLQPLIVSVTILIENAHFLPQPNPMDISKHTHTRYKQVQGHNGRPDQDGLRI